MNTRNRERNFPRKQTCISARAIIVAGFLFCASGALAQLPPGGKSFPTYTPLDSWSFNDTNTWTSDYGYAPLSFTNITTSFLGDGTTLVLDSTNAAWLQYNVMETNGATNLTVDVGSVAFWFAPYWSSTNDPAGGLGPQEWGRLIEAGSYTTNASVGWWSLYLDDIGANLYFSVQPGDGSTTTYLTAPIAWTTNYWHFIVLTYCATNTALYLDGQLATNGPGISSWPGANVLTNGFWIGSDSNGVFQAQGMFDDLYTYNVPLDADTIRRYFYGEENNYLLNPMNSAFMEENLKSSTNSSPSYTPAYDAITGQGNLISLGSASSCVTSSNVWITNIVVTAASGGTMNVTFTIEGGSYGVPYDVFANSVLGFGTNNFAWAWMGQGYQCSMYKLTGLPNTSVFLILGTPLDSDYDGLTDAYKLLVSQIDPNNPDPAGDGIADSDHVLMGVNPLTPIPAIPAMLNIQTCPP